jgi:endonuclease/exonuclease/phosphatase family metal-dependent hydrolase
VRVFSFNVDSCSAGVDGVLGQIEKYSPDIVFLQELGPPSIVAKLAAAIAAKGYPTVRTSSQFLVASRFPVTSSRDPEKLPYEGRPRSPRWVEQIIETPLGPIAFYNVHPISPREGFVALRGSGLKNELLAGRGFPGDGKELVSNNAGLRALQVADFAQAASEETSPVVIAGDTNSPGLSFVVARYLSQYQDGFANAGWGLGYTFPTGRGTWMRIDRMFASSELRFVDFQVCRTTASDHDCIVADLQRAR